MTHSIPVVPSPSSPGERLGYPPAVLPACENCGFQGNDLAVVHRLYVTPETWDTPRSERLVDDTERWCSSCRSQYPHQEAGASR